jgi:hypothetical protein
MPGSSEHSGKSGIKSEQTHQKTSAAETNPILSMEDMGLCVPLKGPFLIRSSKGRSPRKTRTGCWEELGLSWLKPSGES